MWTSLETISDDMFSDIQRDTFILKWQISAPAACVDKNADTGCQIHM